MPPSVLITGGAGFVGTNLCNRLLELGERVTILDNLSRDGCRQNLDWLQAQWGDRLRFRHGDVRDPDAVRTAVRDAAFVFHFAAQVAVTTSVEDPWSDFSVNAGGTLTVLEELRRLRNPPGLLFTSTNKVYGALSDLSLHRDGKRYQPDNPTIARKGISENRCLDFHSPYGCSKGAADQYVLDFTRTYSIPAIVFRMSCIYGPHQFGTEDQGWVAHFIIRALQGRPIALYGDGMQVRDLLFVDDLVEAFLLARPNISRLSGRAFNIGGGAGNTASLLELVDLIETYLGTRPQLTFGDWRAGDQRYYVSDTTRFRMCTGWYPRVSVEDGFAALSTWLVDSRSGVEAPAAKALK